MIPVEQILEFNKVREQLKSYAYTEETKNQIENLSLIRSQVELTARLRETTEGRVILDKIGNPPLASIDAMSEYIAIAEKGGCLTAEQLEIVANNLTMIWRMKEFLNRCKSLELSLPYYEENLNAMNEVKEEINRVIRHGGIDDFASPLLKKVRSEMHKLEVKMREKADGIMKANKQYMNDSFCVNRNGHLCVPVKKEYKLKISGTVMDTSSTGSTLFIEPTQVAKLSEELEYCKIDEEKEERRILYVLTAMLANSGESFRENKVTIEKLDYIFARAKLSKEYRGVEPRILEERKIRIVNGRHPLMNWEECVPLQFQMGEGIQGVIITGPNTGGKTVAIKTVGLNCYMAQCGLHVSCEKAELCMNDQILCDIGDGQNISENLSTFSAHIVNVLEILKKAGRNSLVIMDELGSGTDPTEGMGIAIAILEELKKRGVFFLVTTHYPEVKTYASQAEGVMNARMAFDRESLRPLYRLEVGEAGESCALYIAKRLGMPGSMLKKACQAAYGTEKLNGITFDETEMLQQEYAPKLQRKKRGILNEKQEVKDKFQLGDSVMIYPDRKIGIVCQTINEKGVLRIQMPDKKIWINHKRVKLHVPASQLYPENYDFSIIFSTVEERKARHQMERKYVEGGRTSYRGVRRV